MLRDVAQDLAWRFGRFVDHALRAFDNVVHQVGRLVTRFFDDLASGRSHTVANGILRCLSNCLTKAFALAAYQIHGDNGKSNQGHNRESQLPFHFHHPFATAISC
jgi:hypothetical protein